MNLDIITKNIENVGEAQNPSTPITTPTLFVRGGNSEYIKQEDETLIQHYFTNVDIKTVPNAGHWLHAEQPQSFFDEVMKFIH